MPLLCGWWSWRDSNPRPNKQYISFLHAYSVLDFRRQTEYRHPICRLASEIFVPGPKPPGTYFCIPMPPDQTSQNRTFGRHLASLLYFGKAQNPTVIQIMLQERTLRCQLKMRSKGFKRSRYGSLHAYLPIGLAVETSQPQLISLQIYKNDANNENFHAASPKKYRKFLSVFFFLLFPFLSMSIISPLISKF